MYLKKWTGNGINYAGKTGLELLTDCSHFIQFFGYVSTAVWMNRKIRFRQVVKSLSVCGAGGVWITVLICMLTGVILAYQSSIQLHRFGADSLLPVLIGCAITRELGPLMVAIIASGRCGSAFAAEIGSMKISEELNALKTMGIDPVQFLVLPKIFSMLVAVPALTVIGDAMGMLGGLWVGYWELEIPADQYIQLTIDDVELKYFFEGICKSFFFAFEIALIGSWCGFETGNDAEAVGKSTTSSVVIGILVIVLTDAVMAKIFTVLYQITA